MRGQEDGRSLVAKALDQFPEGAARLWIEACRRFIEEEKLRRSDDAKRNIKATTLPAAQSSDLLIALLVKPYRVDQVSGIAGP